MTELSESIVRLREEGNTYSQIQQKLGCSKGTISYWLGAGQKEKNMRRTRDRRYKIAKYLQSIKQSRPCADCGENYPYWMMEFDHLRDKEFNLSGFKGSQEKMESIVAEVEKCEVVCSNCHKNRTFVRALSSGAHSPDVSMHYLK